MIKMLIKQSTIRLKANQDKSEYLSDDITPVMRESNLSRNTDIVNIEYLCAKTELKNLK